MTTGRDRAEGIPTTPTPVGLDAVRRARNLRRVVIAALAVFVGLGLSGVFGARTATVSAAGGGYRLTVSYPAVTRPGLAVRYSIRVDRPGGLDGPVTVSTTRAYLELFDVNALDPQPASTTTAAGRTLWTFEDLAGETLTVTLDARTEPARESGAEARTELLVAGRPVVRVAYRTVVMP
jgi:hypothetical protein